MKIVIDSERAGIIFLKGGYRAYWVRYSYGKVFIKGRFRNLWCKPRFEICDARHILKDFYRWERRNRENENNT